MVDDCCFVGIFVAEDCVVAAAVDPFNMDVCSKK